MVYKISKSTQGKDFHLIFFFFHFSVSEIVVSNTNVFILRIVLFLFFSAPLAHTHAHTPPCLISRFRIVPLVLPSGFLHSLWMATLLQGGFKAPYSGRVNALKRIFNKHPLCAWPSKPSSNKLTCGQSAANILPWRKQSAAISPYLSQINETECWANLHTGELKKDPKRSRPLERKGTGVMSFEWAKEG